MVECEGYRNDEVARSLREYSGFLCWPMRTENGVPVASDPGLEHSQMPDIAFLHWNRLHPPRLHWRVALQVCERNAANPQEEKRALKIKPWADEQRLAPQRYQYSRPSLTFNGVVAGTNRPRRPLAWQRDWCTIALRRGPQCVELPARLRARGPEDAHSHDPDRRYHGASQASVHRCWRAASHLEIGTVESPVACRSSRPAHLK